jgi:hypothetical protein
MTLAALPSLEPLSFKPHIVDLKELRLPFLGDEFVNGRALDKVLIAIPNVS